MLIGHGGTGAFVMTAQDYDDFAEAILAKLVKEIAGVPIKKGDWLMVNFAAANLDCRLFYDNLWFDVERENADKQIAFGFGMHFCLGAQLARLEMRSLFEHLVPEISELEIAGTPTTVQGVFVSGHKQLPIRYRLH